MSETISFGEVDVNLVSSMDGPVGQTEPDTRFRILVFGDFSGRDNRGIHDSVTDRKPISIDRDNFDDVLSELTPELQLFFVGSDSPPISIRFDRLDDFHPDRLFERLNVFQALRQALQDLEDPDALEAVAARLGNWTDMDLSSQTRDTEEKTDISPEEIVSETESLLDMILDETEASLDKSDKLFPSSSWDAFLHRIVQPHIIPEPDPRRTELKISVEAAISDVMRRILHDPDFQALESNWRGLFWLTSRLKTGESLRLHLVDVSKEELSEDLLSTESLNTTGTYKILVEAVNLPGETPWSILAGCYRFGPNRKDAEILGRLAILSDLAGAPFLSGAEDRLLGCASLPDTRHPEDWEDPFDSDGDRAAWKALRELPEASHIGLLLPRFMLRLPFGKDTDPTESFEFEEMPDESVHDWYAWGNPSLAAAYLLCESFYRSGWKFHPGMIQNIEDLPLHVFTRQGQPEVKPPAEVFLSERAAEAIMEKGVMPLLSIKHRDVIRLARFQSIADPSAGLAGPWG